MIMVMGLFSRPLGKKTGTGGFSEKVSKSLETLFRRIARWLNGKTDSYSPAQWFMLLISFFLLTGSYCIYLIVSSIW
ncbi:hypothetical protein SAMN06265348_10654 [Pedobacter westerhofensis]|uniref:Uncharacterized protein n=1 Tax=Pedobacter westerhofensis TaxID=425512 RepID=A0A521DPA4_9SPHI|nr:hypothetical protein SAMN06265348_10654 [Pedobacter westerhofensis]